MYGQPVYQQPGFQQPQVQLPGLQPQQQMYQQPGYQPQMQMQQMPQQPIIIHVDDDNNNGSVCPYCAGQTPQIPRKKVGCVAIAWCFCLLPTVLCCIPFCMDGCKDTELVCVKCQQVKMTLPANCC